MSEDVENPTSPGQELAWMARSDTDSSATDDDTTSEELDSESDEEDDDDDSLTKPTRGERLLQIAKEIKEVEKSKKESGQELAWMTQSDTDPPMTDDDTTSGESDSGSDKGDEDDSLTKQTRGERLLQVAKEAIEAEESENNARTRGDGLQRAPTQPPRPGRKTPQPPSSVPRAAWEGVTTTRQRPPAAQRNRRAGWVLRGEEQPG